MVIGKIYNQAVLLRRRARRSLEPDQVWDAVSRLAGLEQAAGSAARLPELLGIEGAAAGIYFTAIRSVVIPGHGFAARRREGRDLVNVLINYCSALLRETVMSALLAAGLDPYLSFLHTPTRGRPALAFDLMEEWCPVLLESTVLALLGLRSVTADDLTDDGERPCLSPAATGAAVMRFQHRLAAPARSWPPPPGSPSYADQVHRQALALRTALLGDPGSYRAFRWR